MSKETHVNSSGPDLEVTCSREDDRVIAHVAGEIDLHTAPLLEQRVRRYEPFDTALVLDLAGVPFIDSSGLRGLLSLHEQVLASSGSPLELRDVQPAPRRVLEITGLDKVFVVS